MSKEKKLQTSLYYDGELMDKVKMIVLQLKKWKNVNHFIIEAITEKLEKESCK